MNEFYFNAISVYRVSRFFYLKKLKKISKIFDVFTYVLFKCSIPGSCDIGAGTYCSHRGIAVVIHPDSIIGECCVIGAGVSLGGKGKGIEGAPTVLNNVYLATGTKVIGNVTIGENSITGANSVVLNDIGNNSIAVGIPAKAISNY
jgi:serine O-acetyltransferase